ncbi:MAG: hypothetical protein EOO65_02100 [Methanosarcinales archaeon]|nr:MAG: hypothetical protein EOO65_02100 [Methanosarcinales archaeon]
MQPGEPHADGKKHLLIPHGGYSRLAQAMGSNTQLAPVESHYLCGDKDVSEDEVMRATLAIAAISYRSPRSLENSMRTWRDNGLLDVVDEKMLFLNSPSEEDINIGRTYDFDVYTTLESNGNVMVGKALAYLVDNSSADYILLMEKDFILNSPPDVTKRELYTGMQLLANGVDAYRYAPSHLCVCTRVRACCIPFFPFFFHDCEHGGRGGEQVRRMLVCVLGQPPSVRAMACACTCNACLWCRLRGQSDFPAEGNPDCCTPRNPPTCPYLSHWGNAGSFGDHMNWLLIYCDPNVIENSRGRIAHCTFRRVRGSACAAWVRHPMMRAPPPLRRAFVAPPAPHAGTKEPEAPESYCFTSGETNWSNNPIIFRRDWFEKRLRAVATRPMEGNQYFEFYAMLEWLTWNPPAIVCTSLRGIFTHFEVDQ